MGFELRLKTGFFETKIFELLIGKGKLVLISKEASDEIITVQDKEIIKISLKNEKSLEMELHTWDKIYQGVFTDKHDFEELLRQLEANINKKIVCEYEGGN